MVSQVQENFKKFEELAVRNVRDLKRLGILNKIEANIYCRKLSEKLLEGITESSLKKEEDISLLKKIICKNSDDKLYEVDRILNQKVDSEGIKYLIKWIGYPEPETSFDYDSLFKEYWQPNHTENNEDVRNSSPGLITVRVSITQNSTTRAKSVASIPLKGLSPLNKRIKLGAGGSRQKIPLEFDESSN